MPIEFRRNRNGFAVATVHYSADPAKDAAWVERERAGMPEWSWRKEYEMDPYAASGKPVFPELARWAPHIHVPLAQVVKGGAIPDWWPRYAGFDWGRRNPSAFELCAIGPDEQIIFYWELYRPELKPQQLDRILRAHPDWNRIEFIGHDPSMTFMTAWGGGVREGDEQRALADVFAEMGWTLVPGIRGDDVTFAQELLEAWRDLSNPRIIITQSCPRLWDELKGLRHEELNVTAQARKNEPEQIVKKANHAFHAIKYLLRLNPAPPSMETARQWMGTEAKAKLVPTRRNDEEPEDLYLGAYS